MTYFGQKVRNCLIIRSDIEITLLKLFIQNALFAGLAVSYNNRVFLISNKNENTPIQIVRSSEPTRAIEIPSNRVGDAVDRFIDSFVYEDDANLDNIIFHHSNDHTDAGNTWWLLKQAIPGISTILNSKPPLSQLLIKISEETNESVEF